MKTHNFVQFSTQILDLSFHNKSCPATKNFNHPQFFSKQTDQNKQKSHFCNLDIKTFHLICHSTIIFEIFCKIYQNFHRKSSKQNFVCKTQNGSFFQRNQSAQSPSMKSTAPRYTRILITCGRNPRKVPSLLIQCGLIMSLWEWTNLAALWRISPMTQTCQSPTQITPSELLASLIWMRQALNLTIRNAVFVVYSSLAESAANI